MFVSKDNPLGNAGLIANVLPPYPPLVVTGVNDSALTFCIIVFGLLIASVLVRGTGVTVKLNVDELFDCPA